MKKEILTEISTNLNGYISKTIKETLEASVEKEIKKALKKAISDGEFYQTITTEIQDGLNQLMKELQELKMKLDIEIDQLNESQGKVSNGAADKLSLIYSRTEDATLVVMDIVENLMEEIKDAKEKKISDGNEKVENFLNSINYKLINMMTSLSVHDIIDQQIKKVVDFIKNIEEIINRLYLSQNMMLEKKQENPEKNADEIKKDVDLKISQETVDQLLKEFGL